MGVRSTVIDWFFKGTLPAIEEVKATPPSVTLSGITPSGSPASYSPRNSKSYAQFGYQNNVTVYRAINIVAQSCASVDWNVYKTGTGNKKQRTQIFDHPLVTLLKNPNKGKARSSFIEQFISYWMISGSNYMLGSFSGNDYQQGMKPLGLYNLRPDLIEQIAGDNGEVVTYKYDVGYNRFINYPAWKIMPIRFFHPLDELAGLSVIQVAAAVIERQNAGEEWNFHLMRNMARPSGAFVAATEFSDEGRARMKREVMNKYGRGKLTAGMPMLLENGLSYVQLAINPVDADWFNSDAAAGRKIASAIGVDPLLLQDKQYSTYNNELEAKLAMWELTCFPMMEKVKDELNAWLLPFYGDGIEIDYDREPIESLKRNRQLESVTTIAEWNTGVRSFNSSAMDLMVDPVPEKDDFYRFGPAMFVRKSQVGEFLDAQKFFWMPPPVDPMTGLAGKPGQRILPTPEPQNPAAAGLSLSPASPSVGNVRLDTVPRRPVPMLVAPKPYKSADGENVTNTTRDYILSYRQSEKFRSTWQSYVTQGLSDYIDSEMALVLNACKAQKSQMAMKSLALTQNKLHQMQLQELFAGWYASIASEAGRQVTEQFGEKFVFTKGIIEEIGRYANPNVQLVAESLESTLAMAFTVSHSPLSGLANEIRSNYTSYKQKRLATFSAHSVALAANVGSFVAARQLQIPVQKTWVSCGLCHQDMTGKTTDIAGAFDVYGIPMLFPKDTSMGAEDEECGCTLMYTLDFSESGYEWFQQKAVQA